MMRKLVAAPLSRSTVLLLPFNRNFTTAYERQGSICSRVITDGVAIGVPRKQNRVRAAHVQAAAGGHIGVGRDDGLHQRTAIVAVEAGRAGGGNHFSGIGGVGIFHRPDVTFTAATAGSACCAAPFWSRPLIGAAAQSAAGASSTAGLTGTSTWVSAGPPLLARVVFRISDRWVGLVPSIVAVMSEAPGYNACKGVPIPLAAMTEEVIVAQIDVAATRSRQFVTRRGGIAGDERTMEADVGRAAEPAIVHPAPVGGSIAADGAVVERDGGLSGTGIIVGSIVNAATTRSGRVAADGAVVHRHRHLCGSVVGFGIAGDAATISRGITTYSAVVERSH